MQIKKNSRNTSRQFSRDIAVFMRSLYSRHDTRSIFIEYTSCVLFCVHKKLLCVLSAAVCMLGLAAYGWCISGRQVFTPIRRYISTFASRKPHFYLWYTLPKKHTTNCAIYSHAFDAEVIFWASFFVPASFGKTWKNTAPRASRPRSPSACSPKPAASTRGHFGLCDGCLWVADCGQTNGFFGDTSRSRHFKCNPDILPECCHSFEFI